MDLAPTEGLSIACQGDRRGETGQQGRRMINLSDTIFDHNSLTKRGHFGFGFTLVPRGNGNFRLFVLNSAA